jgi:hypothetical protein
MESVRKILALFSSEDGDSMFLQIVGIYLRIHTALKLEYEF